MEHLLVQQCRVVLDTTPCSDVTLAISTSDPSEGLISDSLNGPFTETIQLTWTPTSYNEPRSILVLGQDDQMMDGHIPYEVLFGEAVSTDSRYAGIKPRSINLLNVDNESASIEIQPVTGLTTTEGGGKDTFEVFLTTPPSDNVSVDVSVDQPTEALLFVQDLDMEVGFRPSSTIEFSAEAGEDLPWFRKGVVNVKGVDDQSVDGCCPFKIFTGPVTSHDSAYCGLDPPDINATNMDDDVASILVDCSFPLLTSETGEACSFKVCLSSKPQDHVVVSLMSTDTSEGVVTPVEMTFTANDWAEPKTANVLGIDDGYKDYDVDFEVVLLGHSQDSFYNKLRGPNISVTNIDNEKQEVTVEVVDMFASEDHLDPGSIRFTRNGALRDDLLVEFKVGGSAIEGVDFIDLGDSCIIPRDENSIDLTIQPIEDVEFETCETILITPLRTHLYWVSNPPSVARLVIEDDDLPDPVVSITPGPSPDLVIAEMRLPPFHSMGAPETLKTKGRKVCQNHSDVLCYDSMEEGFVTGESGASGIDKFGNTRKSLHNKEVLDASPYWEIIMDNRPTDGDDGNRINLAVLGDAYHEDELPKFRSKAEDALSVLFTTNRCEPLRTYQRFFNVYRMDLISASSPFYSNEDTALRTIMSSGAPCVDIARAKCFAEMIPGFKVDKDTIIAIVNVSTGYNNGSAESEQNVVTQLSGGEYGSFTLNLPHEIGHAFGDMGDEPWENGSRYRYPNLSHLCWSESKVLSATCDSCPDMAATRSKWYRWLGDGFLSETHPDYVDTFSTYGRDSLPRAPYRPSEYSIMTKPCILIQEDAVEEHAYFKPVHREQMIKRIYANGLYDNHKGQMVYPIDTATPDCTQHRFQEFFVDVVDEEIFDVTWTLCANGHTVQQVTGVYTFGPIATEYDLFADYVLSVTVTDNTDWVRDEDFRARWMTESRAWHLIPIEIHYTIDDSEPTRDSPTYFGPITLPKSSVIRARAFAPCSPVENAVIG